jgi:hypothetical protein
LSASSGRTVREHTADSPQGSGGLSENDSQPSSIAAKITDRSWRHLGPSTTNSPHADCPRILGRPSAKPPATENSWKIGSKERRSRTSEEHEEHQLSCLHVDCPWPIGGPSARHEQSSPSLKPREPNHLPVHGSPKWLKLLRKDLGRCEASLGDAMSQNLCPQTN